MSSSCYLCHTNKPDTLSGQSVLNRIHKFMPDKYDLFCKKGFDVNLSGRRYCPMCLCVTFEGWDKIPGLHKLRASANSLGSNEDLEEEEEEEVAPQSPPKRAKTQAEAVASSINALKNHPVPQVTSILTPAQKEEQMLLQIRKDLFSANYQKVGAGLNLIKIRGFKNPDEMKKLAPLLAKITKMMEEAGIFSDD